MSKKRNETGDVGATVCMCVRSEIKARRVTEHEDDMSTRAWLRTEEGSNSSGLSWIRVWSTRYPAGGSVVGVWGAPGVGAGGEVCVRDVVS